ncbi:MAG: ketoacyl-ACP synthase III [Saprospiraceae bacterium]|nr:ketoacyl-ACP synthase III [Saprospiraceae bacterium]
MTKIKACIAGVHGFVPDYVLTNAELESMVDTNDEWIQSRTGIKQRHILKGEDKGTSHMAIKAVEGLLQKTNTDPAEIDLTICATVTPDSLFPDTANTINAGVGAVNAWGFDLNAACSGFLFGLTTGAKFVETGTHKKVLVIGADTMSSIVNYQDRSTCVIFGDGAAAVLLEPNEDGFGVQDEILKGDGEGRQYLHMKAGGSRRPASAETVANGEHFVYQDGRPVFKAAVKGMSNTVTEVMQRNQLTVDDIDWLVPHQANLRIITSVANALSFPMEKVIVNIQNYGNTTGATIPLCLWDAQQKFRKGDKILLTAFGGGFTWGASYLTWGYDS